MKRSLYALPTLLVLLPMLASAQIAAPTSPTATRPSPVPAPPRIAPPPVPSPAPPLAPITPRPPQPVPSMPTDSRPAAGPIRSQGPAQAAPLPQGGAPGKVYDREGRILPGVHPAGPNRVFDSRTGRYYDSTSQGSGQQIKPPQ